MENTIIQFALIILRAVFVLRALPVHVYQLIKRNRSFDDSTFRHTEIYLKLHETHRICSDSLSLANTSVNAVVRTPKVFVQISNQIIIVRKCNKLPTVPRINFFLCKCLEVRSTSTFHSLRFSSLLLPSLVILFSSKDLAREFRYVGGERLSTLGSSSSDKLESAE